MSVCGTGHFVNGWLFLELSFTTHSFELLPERDSASKISPQHVVTSGSRNINRVCIDYSPAHSSRLTQADEPAGNLILTTTGFYGFVFLSPDSHFLKVHCRSLASAVNTSLPLSINEEPTFSVLCLSRSSSAQIHSMGQLLRFVK